jgi:hypothetical protein
VHDEERRGGRRAVVVVIISRVQGMDGNPWIYCTKSWTWAPVVSGLDQARVPVQRLAPASWPCTVIVLECLYYVPACGMVQSRLPSALRA